MEKSRLITQTLVLLASRLEGIGNKYVYFPMQMTSASAKILKLLLGHGNLTPMQIMELSGNTKSNVSQRLNFLEKKAYIERVHNKIDRRKVLIKLTTAGREKINESEIRFKKAHRILGKHFNQKETDEFISFANKFNKLIEDEEENLPKYFSSK